MWLNKIFHGHSSSVFVVVVVAVVDLEKTLARRVEYVNGYLGKLTSF